MTGRHPLRDYLRHIEEGRQLSPHTVAAYRRDLVQFREWMDTHRPGWEWDDVGRLDLRAYLGHLGRRGLARRSIGRKLSAIRGFFRHLHRELTCGTEHERLHTALLRIHPLDRRNGKRDRLPRTR